MNNKFILHSIFGLLFIMTSCDSHNQNDFVASITIGKIEDKKIYCDLYQTGIDIYRYDFKLIDRNDTINLFATYLNGATPNNSRFTMDSKGKNVMIKSNKPIGRAVRQVDGLTIAVVGNNK